MNKDANLSVHAARVPTKFEWLGPNDTVLHQSKLPAWHEPLTGNKDEKAEQRLEQANALLDDAPKNIDKQQFGERRCLPLMNHWRELVAP